ncbi:MAG: hypothetical protein IRZ26_01990 [Clostridia bacterium]|nr:hypothetical protein [Clostridia bacterium]
MTRIRGFWSDADGLSVADIVSLLVAVAFAVTVGADLTKLIRGTLAANDVDLLNVLVWPVLVVLGGGAASMFLPSLRQPRYGSGYVDPYPPVMPSPPPAAATSQQPEDVQPQTGPPSEGGPSI